MAGAEGNPVNVLRGNDRAGLLFVCEHASNFIPEQFEHLGLPDTLWKSHIAWDPGAAEVTEHLRQQFEATSVAGGMSRLLYDCNRPPSSSDAVPEMSEIYSVPGNVGLTQKQRKQRVEQIYVPFEQALEAEIERQEMLVALVTLHSFTPVYRGKNREVELGILHDTDTRLADAMLEFAPEIVNLNVQRNEPYGPLDGVTHTLKRHAVSNGLLNVMVEISSDLLSTPAACLNVAQMLAELLNRALENIVPDFVRCETEHVLEPNQ